MEAGRRRAAGALEAAVMGVLWAADSQLTVAQVGAGLPDALAHTTVLTILSRLHAKGQLTRVRSGRGYAYAPLRDEAADTAERMFGLLDRGSDRRAVLARFVSRLSDEDERLVQQLLRGHEGS
jgi:predicted transcriptional regulator